MVSGKDMTSSLDSLYMRSRLNNTHSALPTVLNSAQGILTRDISYITSLGAYAMIVPHNDDRFYDSIITDPSAFQAFRMNIATLYVNNGLAINLGH